jgi:peptide deformylase
MSHFEIPCPCGSSFEYENCCEPLHKGVLPKNALQLMRSRYSAYVLNLSGYIIETTHPASPQYSENTFMWKRKIADFCLHSTFKKLDILEFKEKGTLATVIFTAHILQESEDATFTEKSYFEKVNDRWLYRGGQLQRGLAPNMITTGELKLLPLSYYDDEILRRKADPIQEITKDIEKLIEEMIETMDACDGIGLAAPQVHHSIRLFVIRTPIEKDDDSFEAGDVKVFINPVLSGPSDETWKAPEGCLSIPTIRSLVERPREITVEYTAIDGSKKNERFSGWAARVIMHENDHIDGILFIDRLETEEKEKLAPILLNLKNRIHDGKAL